MKRKKNVGKICKDRKKDYNEIEKWGTKTELCRIPRQFQFDQHIF